MADDFNPSNPIYYQLVERISRRIVRGDLKPGDKIPSVRETAVDSGVNPNTVQRTYSELERMKVVETKRGQGTFVTEDETVLSELRETLKSEQIDSFVRDMKDMGYTSEEMMNGLRDYLASVQHEEDDND